MVHYLLCSAQVAIAFGYCANLQPQVARAELVAHWNFEDISGNIARDVSGSGHDGDIESAAPAAGPPGFGSALFFDGENGAVLVEDAADLNSPSITVEAWIYPTNVSEGRTYEIVDKTAGNGQSADYGYRFAIQGGSAPFLVFYVRTADGTESMLATAPWTYPLSQWYLVAGSWNDDTKSASVCVNNQLVDARAYIGMQRSFDDTTLSIGRNRFGAGAEGETFEGKIDEVKIFNTAYIHTTCDTILIPIDTGGCIGERIRVPIVLSSCHSVCGITVPLRYSGSAGFDSVRFDGTCVSGWELQSVAHDSASKTILIGLIADLGGGTPCFLSPVRCTVAYVDFRGAESCVIDSIGSYWPSVCVDTANLGIDNRPLVVDSLGVEYTPAFSSGCAVRRHFRAGDANCNCLVNAADIICTVNYVFKGLPRCCPQPFPDAEPMDTNGDCSVTSSDIIYLVNEVFKGGPKSKCAECQ
jgi:hypothetical protein